MGRRWRRGRLARGLAGTIVCGALPVCIASARAAQWGTGIPRMPPEPWGGVSSLAPPPPSTSLPGFRVLRSLTPVQQRGDREEVGQV